MQAVIFAGDIGLREIIVEGDVFQVISSLNQINSQLHSSGVIIWDAKQALLHFDNWSTPSCETKC